MAKRLFMLDTITVLQRMDGAWVVVVVNPHKGPMEFVCESEDQARGFATNLSRPARPAHSLGERPQGNGWFKRLLRVG